MSESNAASTPKTSPRVFHRGKGTLVILWDKLVGVDDTSAILTIRCVTNDQDARDRAIPVDALTYSGEFRKRIVSRLDASTIVCEVIEEKAGMTRKDEYYLRIKHGNLVQGVRVYPEGVKRPFERKDGEKHVHLHAW